MISRERIFRYVKKKYGVEPDYPLPTAPSFPVLCHTDNRKWFALIMDVPKEKLWLQGIDRVDIINVKLGDPLLVDLLIHQEGYFKNCKNMASVPRTIERKGSPSGFAPKSFTVRSLSFISAKLNEPPGVKSSSLSAYQSNGRYSVRLHIEDNFLCFARAQGKGLFAFRILPVVVNSQNMKCRFQLSDDVCHGVRIAEGTRQHDDHRSIFLSIGIPRMVNRICEKSLMYAFQQQRKLIDDYMVTFVVENEIAR